MSDIKGVLLDLSGVVYQGSSLLPGAVKAVERLREIGLPVRYITNTTRQTHAAILERLTGMGLPVDGQELFTATRTARQRLAERGLTPWLLVHPNLEPELRDLTGETPNAVLVADAGEGFTYAAMNRAFRLLMDGAPLLAICRNRYFREDDGLSLDAGPFVAALEYAADTEAEILGKPAPAMFHAAVQSMGCAPEETVMVGDDVESDVNGAVQAGLTALLVRTGKYREGDEGRMAQGAEMVADISEAVEWIAARAARGPD